MAWHDIATPDEPWFYVVTDYETIWLPSGMIPPQRKRRTIQSKKMMVIIVWNPTGFYRFPLERANFVSPLNRQFRERADTLPQN
jgi:hypothetical protein